MKEQDKYDDYAITLLGQEYYIKRYRISLGLLNMNTVELTNTELFKDLTTVVAGEVFFDLHNDYVCTDIDYKLETKSLMFLFEAYSTAMAENHLCLLFENVTFSTFKFIFNRTVDSGTLDSFYRGRFRRGDTLFDYAPTGEAYFYIEFEEGDSFELFSSKVVLFEKKASP